MAVTALFSDRRRLIALAVVVVVLVFGGIFVATRGDANDTGSGHGESVTDDSGSRSTDPSSDDEITDESDDDGTSETLPSEDYPDDTEPAANEPSADEQGQAVVDEDVQQYLESQRIQRQAGVDNESLLNKNAEISSNNLRNNTGW